MNDAFRALRPVPARAPRCSAPSRRTCSNTGSIRTGIATFGQQIGVGGRRRIEHLAENQHGLLLHLSLEIGIKGGHYRHDASKGMTPRREAQADTPPGGAWRGPRLFEMALPDAPGVYRMMDAKGDVLYVGKAKSSKKRVASYAKSGGYNERDPRMIADTMAMLFVTTASETEVAAAARIQPDHAEAALQCLHRDDKSFPNISCARTMPFRSCSGASRCTFDQRHLFQAVRERAGGWPYAEHAAARVSGALLLDSVHSSRVRGHACCSRSNAAARPCAGTHR